MNERIKELARQAGFMVDQSGHIMVCFTSDGNDEVEKFAELMVNEFLVLSDQFEIEVNRSGLVDRVNHRFDIK